MQTPRAPPEADLPANPRGPLSRATIGRQDARRDAFHAGKSTWESYPAEHSQSAPDLGASMSNAGASPPSTSSGVRGRGKASPKQVRGTLASDARVLLSHTRRFGMAGGERHLNSTELSTMSQTSLGSAAWASMRDSRMLPRPVREWAERGLEFTDGGLGIGDRFDKDLQRLADRAPGYIYDTMDFGSVSRFSSDAPLPTRQAEGRHVSTETHKMGAKRVESSKADRMAPGPGTYEKPGFTDELLYNLARRAQATRPRDGEGSGASGREGKKAMTGPPVGSAAVREALARG